MSAEIYYINSYYMFGNAKFLQVHITIWLTENYRAYSASRQVLMHP